MENRNLKIGVIGLGLIGGSILKSLNEIAKDEGFQLIGVSKSSYNKASGFCSVSSPDIKAVKDCDIVFVCLKMADTLKILDELEGIVGKNCVVTDVSSLKRFVNNKKRPYNFIGSHPMAGTEFTGFENSFNGLFLGAKWILNKNCELLESLILKMGAKPIIMDENTHDKFACLISHLPMLVSAALMSTVAENDKEALKLAASGFRDTTRLTLTNPDLASSMLELNSDNFDIVIEEFIKNLRALKNMPKMEFIEKLNVLQNIRKNMYDKDGKNNL